MGGMAVFRQSQSVSNVNCFHCWKVFEEALSGSGKAAVVASSTVVFLDSFACTCFYLVFFYLQ